MPASSAFSFASAFSSATTAAGGGGAGLGAVGWRRRGRGVEGAVEVVVAVEVVAWREEENYKGGEGGAGGGDIGEEGEGDGRG